MQRLRGGRRGEEGEGREERGGRRGEEGEGRKERGGGQEEKVSKMIIALYMGVLHRERVGRYR